VEVDTDREIIICNDREAAGEACRVLKAGEE